MVFGRYVDHCVGFYFRFLAAYPVRGTLTWRTFSSLDRAPCPALAHTPRQGKLHEQIFILT
jgi:hypothetical protein